MHIWTLPSPVTQADTISVNFNNGQFTLLELTDVVGVVPHDNWNNFANNGGLGLVNHPQWALDLYFHRLQTAGAFQKQAHAVSDDMYSPHWWTYANVRLAKMTEKYEAMRSDKNRRKDCSTDSGATFTG